MFAVALMARITQYYQIARNFFAQGTIAVVMNL